MPNLNHLIQFLAKNYAGYHFKQNEKISHFEQQNAKAKLNEVLIKKYLKLFNDKHLYVVESKQEKHKTKDSFFKPLTETIAYMQINDFMLTEVVEDLVQQFQQKQYEHLIIDLSNNYGGIDTAWQILLPIVFPQEKSLVKVPNQKHLVTAQNIALRLHFFEKLKMPQQQIMAIQQSLEEKIQANGEGFYYLMGSAYWQENIVGQNYPQKVSIIIGQKTGSSAEYFTYIAKQSKKVSLVGENTAGAFDYTNVCQYKIPNTEITVQYATSASTLVFEGKGMDNIGIAPHIKIKDENIVDYCIKNMV